MPISMNTGLSALIRWVSTRTPTTLSTPGVPPSFASSDSSIVLAKVSDAPFWATVKSALPTEMMAAADCSRPLLVTSRVTTAITAIATANARPMERAFLDHRLRRTSPKTLTGLIQWSPRHLRATASAYLRAGNRSFPRERPVACGRAVDPDHDPFDSCSAARCCRSRHRSSFARPSMHASRAKVVRRPGRQCAEERGP